MLRSDSGSCKRHKQHQDLCCWSKAQRPQLATAEGIPRLSCAAPPPASVCAGATSGDHADLLQLASYTADVQEAYLQPCKIFCGAVVCKCLHCAVPSNLQTPAPTPPPPVPFAAQLQQLLATLGTGRPITYKNVEVKYGVPVSPLSALSISGACVLILMLCDQIDMSAWCVLGPASEASKAD